MSKRARSGSRAKKRSTEKHLRRQGFDKLKYNPDEKTWNVRCSLCEATGINGVACHEQGCPNQKKDR